MTIDLKLKTRVDGIREWLIANHPECEHEQLHLKKDTPERAYWHFGYYMALKDVLNLIAGETLPTITENSHRQDTYN